MPSLRLRPALPPVFVPPRGRKAKRNRQRLHSSHPEFAGPRLRASTTPSATFTSFSPRTASPVAALLFWLTSTACSSALSQPSTPTTPPQSPTPPNSPQAPHGTFDRPRSRQSYQFKPDARS